MLDTVDGRTAFPTPTASGKDAGRVGALATCAGALAVGAAAAALVVVDPVVGQILSVDDLGVPWSRTLLFPLTACATALIAATLLVLVCRGVLFRERVRINVAIVVLFAVIPGFHYGPIHPSGFGLIFSALVLLALILVEHWPVRRDGFALFTIGLMIVFTFTSIISGRLAALVSVHTVLTKFVLVLVICGLVIDRRTQQWTLKFVLVLSVASAVVAGASLVLYVTTGYEMTYDDLMEVKNTPFGQMMRTTAFFSTTQGLAHCLILSTCLALFMPGALWLRAAMVGVMGIGIFTTFSAGAYGAMAVGLGLAPFIAYPRYTLHILAGMAAVGVLTYVTGLVSLVMQQILLPLGAGNAEERLEFIHAGLQAIGREPWLGYGVKNIGRIMDTAVHNAYVQMTADIGVIGGSAFVAFMLYLVVMIWLKQKNASDPHEKAWCKGLFLGMIVMSYHFMSEPFYDNTFSWLFMGLTLAAISLPGPERTSPQVTVSERNVYV